MFAAEPLLAMADRVEVRVLRPGGSQVVTTLNKSDYVVIPNSSAGPSIVVLLRGSVLRWIGKYVIRARVLDTNGVELIAYSLDLVELLATKDLRIIVSRLWSGTATKPGELEAARSAMQRMSWLFPIRDGIRTLDEDLSAGLRYILDDNPMGPPNQDGHLCPLFSKYINRPEPSDSIDGAITYRFPNQGEGSGGNSGHLCPGQAVPFSVIVWGAPLANPFCQETAHPFGLEAAESPHLDPNFDAHHSKDEKIDPLDAELGFDVQFNAPFPTPTYDVMYPRGPDPEYVDNAHSLNSWDWEYLRKKIAVLPSTGPTTETIHVDRLAQLKGVLCLAGYYAADDDIQHAIVATADGNLTEVYWKPGQGVHQDVLTYFDSDILGVAGYYAVDDKAQHMIVATQDGNLTELYTTPA
jgi:hypothetical protein